LNDSGFLSNVNFLTTTNKSNYHTPLRDSFGKLDEVFWLRFSAFKSGSIAMLLSYLVSVKSPLGFIKNQYVLRRNQVSPG